MSLKRLWLRPALGLLAAVVAAGGLGLYYNVSAPALLRRLDTLDLRPLLIVALGVLLQLALQSLRWWIVVRPVLPLRYGQAFKAMAVGFACNVLLPARGGDLLRVQYLGKRTGLSRAKLLGTEIVDFWSDKWGWVAAFPVLCLFATPPSWLLRALAVMGAVVVGVGALVVVLATGAGGQKLTQRFVWLQNLQQGFAANHWKRLLLVETLIAPLPWLLETMLIVVAGHAFGLSLSPMQAFAVLTGSNLATVVPMPANAGAFETGGTVVLAQFGVPHDAAVAFIFVYHLVQVLPQFALGAVVVGLDSQSLFRRRPRGTAAAGASSPAVRVRPVTAEPDAG